MAKIIPPQDIPSELLDKFSAIGGVARPNDVAERRYPWRIKQPGTSLQRDVWRKFLYCTACFEDQTPAMRQWWYEQSIPSGLFYYTYFMSQTLPIVHQGLIPFWCGVLFSENFPGTSLDLNKWFIDFEQGDLPWSVDEKLFYYRYLTEEEMAPELFWTGKLIIQTNEGIVGFPPAFILNWDWFAFGDRGRVYYMQPSPRLRISTPWGFVHFYRQYNKKTAIEASFRWSPDNSVDTPFPPFQPAHEGIFWWLVEEDVGDWKMELVVESDRQALYLTRPGHSKSLFIESFGSVDSKPDHYIRANLTAFVRVQEGSDPATNWGWLEARLDNILLRKI